MCLLVGQRMVVLCAAVSLADASHFGDCKVLLAMSVCKQFSPVASIQTLPLVLYIILDA